MEDPTGLLRRGGWWMEQAVFRHPPSAFLHPTHEAYSANTPDLSVLLEGTKKTYEGDINEINPNFNLNSLQSDIQTDSLN